MVRRLISLWLVTCVLAGCAGGAETDGADRAWGDVPAPSGSAVPATQALPPGPGGLAGSAATDDPSLLGQAGVGSAPPAAGTGTQALPVMTPPGVPPATPPADPTVPPATPATPVTDSGSGADPIIPAVTGDCPSFSNGTVNFMGLGGIQIVAGPKAAGPSAPMVFYWHGTGGQAGEFAFQAGAVRDGVVAEGGVLISFQGTTGGDLLSGTLIFGAGDFAIADQLVACAVRDHNVDPRRIFATGCSAGGLFASAMAAARSNYMAAAAPNSGGWVVPVAFQNDYTPALMTIHGAPGVDVVAVDFSVTSATADTAFAGRGGFVINCNHGGGHCGGGSLAGSIWQFFKAHPYGVDPEPWSALPAGFHSSCQIY